MADVIEQRFGISPRLIKGRDGVFEVSIGDSKVFSKKELGRFPEPGEVEEALSQQLG